MQLVCHGVEDCVVEDAWLKANVVAFWTGSKARGRAGFEGHSGC